MSKLLVQSRTFLPMVIKKSTGIEKCNPLLEAQPTVANKLDPPLKKEIPEKEIPIEKESPKEKPIKIILMQNSHLADSKDSTVKTFQGRTIVHALIMDVMQIQGWLAKLLSHVHSLMFRHDRVPSTSPTMVVLEGRPRAKEEEPNSILPEHSKTSPLRQKVPENYAARKDDVKFQQKIDTKSSPIKSNVLDSLVERAPEWQKSISANLGALQKKVAKKLLKQKTTV